MSFLFLGKRGADLPRELFTIDIAIGIDRPEYTKNRVRDVIRYKAAKWMLNYLPTEERKNTHSSDKLILDVLRISKRIAGGEEFAKALHVCPTTLKPDVILCYDEEIKKFIEPRGFEGYVIGDVMTPNFRENLKWFCLVPVGVNNIIRYVYEPLGIVKMKMRQLKRLGFEPIIVSIFFFANAI